MKKMPISSMKVKAYAVLQRAVEEGVACGLRRAHKHTDVPTSDAVEEAVERAVMEAICEYFSFDGAAC